MNLVEKAIRTQFIQYFPNPESLKKRTRSKGETESREDNPYRSIISWFDKGNHLNMFFNTTDKEKVLLLYKIDGLHALVKKYFGRANEMEAALLMEFVLHGLSSYSLISKKILETKIEFKDLIGSMMNLGNKNYEEEFDGEDFS
jgi:magnesium chelatase subunit I